MTLFLGWSGPRSRHVATVLQRRLPDFIRDVKTEMSEDIEKGVRWSPALRKALEDCDAGLFCLTPENIDSPWLHFEAGVLASYEKKIFVFLFRVAPNRLGPPFSEYQATAAVPDDFRKLCQSIGETEGDFMKSWRELDRALARVPPLAVPSLVPNFEGLFQRKTYYEPVEECTGQAWVERYVGAIETFKALDARREAVRADAWPHVADLFDELIMEADRYAMDIRALLIGNRFKLDEEGRLRMPKGVRTACERGRMRIRELVLQILASRDGPILDDARIYEKFGTLREKKDHLIHPLEERLDKADDGGVPIDERDIGLLKVSPWDYDRLAWSLLMERRDASIDDLVDHWDRELEKARSEKSSSLIPLHYAIRTVVRALRSDESALPEDRTRRLAELSGRTREHLEKEKDRDSGGHISANLEMVEGEVLNARPDPE